MVTDLKTISAPLAENLKHIPAYFLQPIQFIRSYKLADLRPDLIAGLTVAVVGLPQAIAFALIAELPPEMGLYAAIIGGIIGGLWGSSPQMQTGPSNAISLLVLSSLLAIAAPGSSEFIIAAGLLAVMVGIFQLTVGLARLGMLANFVSHSVIVGFTAGAGVLIAIGQLRYLLGLDVSGANPVDTVLTVVAHLPETHRVTALLGFGTIGLILLMRKFTPKLPDSLISMVIASVLVFIFGLNQAGVGVIGELPSSLPPLAKLPLFNLDLIAKLSTGALAVGLIGLIQSTAIARAISAQTGQRTDSNQEFVGQGLTNIFAGLFSGYPCSGSFSRSAVNIEAGARTPMSAILSSLFILVSMLILAPLAVYLPRTALAGVLLITAYGMVDRAEIARIWRGTRGDALIMLGTFVGTLFLPLEFAVLAGFLFSLAYYIMKTSVPRVITMIPDETFSHFVERPPDQDPCPQLGIIKISGDLYFGAVNHVEEVITQHLADHPRQRFLLLRMHGVNHCDFSGIHMLEAVRRLCQERGGDLYFTNVQEPIRALMQSTGFYDKIGGAHFLSQDEAISFIFHKVLDPAICIYECEVRAFKECQNLPKRIYPISIPLNIDIAPDSVATISPQELWQTLRTGDSSLRIIDVREPREFQQGHIPQAELIPLPDILSDTSDLSPDQKIVLVCRSGRRSSRAAFVLQNKGYEKLQVLEGGILAWETAGLLEATEPLPNSAPRQGPGNYKAPELL
jgi:SulP family sulfate permease